MPANGIFVDGGRQSQGSRLFYTLYTCKRGNVFTRINNPDPNKTGTTPSACAL